jgi:hypothetical protein
MRYITLIILSCLLIFSCQKYKDAPPKNLNLTNPYCNDPAAVNYNWGFPGKPDNTICTYPSDLFTGTDSTFIDSIFQVDLSYTYRDSFPYSCIRLSNTEISTAGFCMSNRSFTLNLTAAITYSASIDTVLGGIGPAFCNIATDTITGTITRDYTVHIDTNSLDSPKIDTILLYVNFQVNSDTGITYHKGTAHIKIKG